MSAALLRARFSSIRYYASAPRCCMRRGTGKDVSSRARQLQSWQSMINVIGDDTISVSRIQVHRISTTTSRQKSALPVSTIIDDDDDDDDTTALLPSEQPSLKSTPFLLADIGEGISEVELLQWFVNPGDTVSQFDRICEVQSDKAAVEITSRFDGVVETLCGEVGGMMFVGKPLLYITTAGNGGEVGASVEVQQQPPQEMTQQTMTLHNVDDEQDRLRIPSAGANYSSHYEEKTMDQNAIEQSPQVGRARATKVLTSPAVRKLGKENNIDLGTVLGTGPRGRVLKADVLKIINSSNNSTVATPPSSSSSLSSAQEKISSTLVSSPQQDTVIPIRGYNRLMVKSMTSSLQIPHMVYADEINVNALTEVRDSLRPLAKEMGVPKLTYLPFFIKATSLALSTYPVLNSTIDVEEMTLTYHVEHNIGVAVDTERGLTVPVVNGCQDRSVLEIAEELNRLYSLAIEGSLSEADITNPTFTLSNIGAIGGTYMSPVVLPPQVAIGAMGKIQRLPRFVSDDSDEVESARIMPISWAGDHRAVDGATMARFSNMWKSFCENPSSMMFAMR